jgi:hypothetical protein
MSNMKNTAKKSSSKESPTVFWMPPLSSVISESLSAMVTPNSITALRIWLQAVSPASPSQSRESKLEKTTLAICGLKPSSAFASYDPASHSWKMSQGFFPLIISDEFSETFPKQGIMQNGLCWERTMWAPTIEENDCGYWLTPTVVVMDGGSERRERRKAYRESTGRQDNCGSLAEQVKYPQMWPTPGATQRGAHTGEESGEVTDTARISEKGVAFGMTLQTAVKRWPTPKSQDSRGAYNDRGKSSLAEEIHQEANVRENGGSLNPTWVEWLMGYPIGWTDLNVSGIQLSHKSPNGLAEES